MARKHEEEILGLRDSLTPGAKQWQYRILSEFPLCPGLDQERTLHAYLDRLTKGEIFLRNANGNTSAIIEAGYNPNKDALYVLLTLDTINSCMLCKVFMQDGFFVHKSIGAFMKLSGGEKYFTLAMDREWTGGRVFDDGCWHGHLE